MDAATRASKLEKAKRARELRIEAETTIELVAEKLTAADVSMSIDKTDWRKLDQDGHTIIYALDLADPDGIAKAVDYIVAHAGDKKAIAFSHLECPKVHEFATNLAHGGIVGRAVIAFDVAEGKRVRRIDFLFKSA